MFDEIDLKLLRKIADSGRITWSDLAGHLGLSAPATAERVRRLEDRGVIRGYAARFDPEALGCPLLALVAVTLEKPSHRAGFLHWVGHTPEVMECHHVAGDDDYLVKLRCAGTQALERLLSEGIKGLPGVVRTRTTIVLSTVKETVVPPLPKEAR